jgi:hypothetical protein
MGRFLWREYGSVIYNCCWPSPAQLFSGSSPMGYITVSDSEFPFRRPLRLAGLWWRYSTTPPHGSLGATFHYWILSLSHITTDGQSASLSWIYVSSFYNLRKNLIQTTTSKSSCYCVLIRWGNVSSVPLPSNGCPSTIDNVTSGTFLLNRCLAMDVSAVLLWLHTSGIQASCHNSF